MRGGGTVLLGRTVTRDATLLDLNLGGRTEPPRGRRARRARGVLRLRQRPRSGCRGWELPCGVPVLANHSGSPNSQPCWHGGIQAAEITASQSAWKERFQGLAAIRAASAKHQKATPGYPFNRS
jgi:hypothetical protein